MREAVWQRAEARCEYCRLPAATAPNTFHLEHVIARQHGGDTVLHNLALSCPRCNLHKGPNLSSVDPQTGQVVRLFNPREDHWVDHFGRIGPTITGKSPTGRATVAALDMNNDDRIILRSLLIEEGVLPRTDP